MLQLLVEGQSTNVVTRSSPTAALPWNDGAVSNGITVTVVGYGMLGDMPYVDYALTGTATANQCGAFAQTGLSNAAATAGETWTASIYTQLISGEWPDGIILGSGVYEQQDNTYLTGTGPGEVPVASLTRLSRTRTLTEAATNLVRSAIQVANMTAGVTTFKGQVVRLAGWSLEKKPGPTSLIQTLSDAAVTRGADETTLSDKATAMLNRDQWTMLIDFVPSNARDDDYSRIIEIVGSGGVASNRISLHRNAVNNAWTGTILSGGTVSGVMAVLDTLYSSGQRARAVLRRDGDTVSMSIDGGAIASTTLTDGYPTLTDGRISSGVTGGNAMDLLLNDFLMWPGAITDAEMLTWSTQS
ncbi:hypothetical protein [Martelella sp. HB161492]|uniref:phage head spike fiber domain-containing protein n=1 Tax=Martelella sp. HB161492 TaxID=2720726 RepID=UPI00159134CB|nr:hypothetical protein [Martelella sp. HB161492]